MSSSVPTEQPLTPTSTSELVAAFAHKLRNPLSAITAIADAVTYDLNDPESVAALERIPSLVERVETLLEQFQRLASLGPPIAAEQPLAGLISSAWQRVADRHGLDTPIKAQLPQVSALVDRDHAIALFEAVLDNAAEVASPGGVCVLGVVDEPSHRVLIDVTDDGDGIPPRSRPRLFDPFYTTWQNTGHVGLGLTMARDMARRNGGDVELVDAEQTTFRCWLPMTPTQT